MEQVQEKEWGHFVADGHSLQFALSNSFVPGLEAVAMVVTIYQYWKFNKSLFLLTKIRQVLIVDNGGKAPY